MALEYIVFYHYPCNDGEIAKNIWELKYPNSNFIPWSHLNNNNNYSILEKELESKNVVFLDLCPSLNLLPIIHSYIIIDHHENAINTMKQQLDLGLSLYKIKMYCNIKISGCMGTWEYCYPYLDYPYIVNQIGKKDIWDFSDVNTEPYNIGYNKYLSKFKDQDYTINPRDASIKRLILNDINKLHSQFIANGYIMIELYKQNALKHFENISLQDEIYNNIIFKIMDITCDDANLFKYLIDIAIESYNADVLRILHTITYDTKCYSLRSLKNNITVDQIARHYGGNGHPKAAGYKIIL
jgi:hypothetical protein